MTTAAIIISGFAVATSGVSVWFARITYKITHGRPLNGLESWAIGRVAR